MIRVAIYGLGNIGRVHFSNLLSIRGCGVRGVFDADPKRACAVAASSGVKVYRSAEELLEDNGVDAVVIATPANSHRELGIQALEAGKHIFVEKPLAGTLADAIALTDAARASRFVAQAGFCERFNPHYIEAKRAASNRRLGRIRSIQTSRVAPYAFSNPQWELGALDTAVHNLDLILWLVGGKPQSVLARGVQVYPDSPIFHSITTMLMFADGALAVDHIAWIKDAAHPLHQCARSRMTLQGDDGMLGVDLTERPVTVCSDRNFGEIDTVILGGQEYYGCLKLQFEAFFRSIEEGTPVEAPLEDALRVEHIALTAKASLESGRELPLEDVS